MINLDAAALIATVYPIAILIIAVEARALPELAPRWPWVKYVNTASSVVALAIVLGGITATANCVRAVVTEEPVVGFDAWVVTASGLGMQLVATIALLGLLMNRFGLDAALSDRIDKIPGFRPRE